MFNFVQNWIAPNARPIGVDFGSDCLRMAQVQFHDGQPRLIAAASADVPASLYGDSEARAKFFVETARDLLAAGNFRGRQILLGLPAAITSIACIKLSVTDESQRKPAIAAVLRDRLGIEPDDALVRDFVIGEPEPQTLPIRQVVAIVASRTEVNRLIAAVVQARLEIVGMNVEPKSLIDCFSHVYLRRSDAISTTCLIDIGCCGTRLVVTRGGHILSVGTIAIGGAHFTRAVAMAMSVSIDEARLQRLKICHADMQSEEHHDKRELYVVRPISASGDIDQQRQTVDAACEELLHSLIRQLEQFRACVTEQFPSGPIDRLVFVGGEAQNRRLCRLIARKIGLPAIVGDPLLRMGRVSDLGFESGLDRREPQPAWAVALGLSLGPATISKRDDSTGDLTRITAVSAMRAT